MQDKLLDISIWVIGCLLAILLVLMFLLVLILPFTNSSENRLERAESHAEMLGLENAKIVCEESVGSCGCTVAYESNGYTQVVTWQCCGGGCQ